MSDEYEDFIRYIDSEISKAILGWNPAFKVLAYSAEKANNALKEVDGALRKMRYLGNCGQKAASWKPWKRHGQLRRR